MSAVTPELLAEVNARRAAANDRRGPEFYTDVPLPPPLPPNECEPDDEPAPSSEQPTTQEPLRGLAYLSKVALVGRERILEMASKPPVYAWQDIAVVGTIIMLAGGPSGGKTTLLFLVLVARMNLGEPVLVLGREVTPAPDVQWVVLIEGEHGESSTCRKLQRSCEIVGVHDLALNRIIIVARKAVRIGSPEWQDVTKLCAAGLVSDIALDTIARVAPGDANDEREQAAIFDLVAQTIEAAPEGATPTVWACAHTRKNGTTDSVDDVSGSAQRTGQADSVLLVRGEKQGGRTISSTVTWAKLREDPDNYPEPCTFSIVVGTDGRRTIQLADEKPDDSIPLETRIENALAIAPRTKGALKKMLGRSDAHIEAAISNLFGAKRIKTAEVTVRGVSRKAFTLRPAGPSGAESHGTLSRDSMLTGLSRDSHGTPEGGTHETS